MGSQSTHRLRRLKIEQTSVIDEERPFLYFDEKINRLCVVEYVIISRKAKVNAMNTGVRARLASIADAEELSRLNQEFNGGDGRPPAQIAKSLNAGNELVAVAEINGRVVGFGCAQSYHSFCYEEPQGEITELYVEEHARRRGIAAAILSCLEDYLGKRGVKEIKVLTGKGNVAAICTYEHSGYVVDDELLLIKTFGD